MYMLCVTFVISYTSPIHMVTDATICAVSYKRYIFEQNSQWSWTYMALQSVSQNTLLHQRLCLQTEHSTDTQLNDEEVS